MDSYSDLRRLCARALSGIVNGLRRPAAFLPKLPVEVLEMIAIFLTSEDYLSFRLACRDIEVKTFHYFALHFFKKKRVLHTKHAFETLVDISKSRFALYVNTLVLGPTHDQGDVHYSLPMDAKKKRKIAADMRAYSAENRYMREIGLDMCMLIAAFEGLRNCTKLKITFRIGCRETYGYCGGDRVGWKYEQEVAGDGDAHFGPRPLHMIQSLARLFTVALHAAQSARLPLEKVVAYGTDDVSQDCIMAGYTTISLAFPIADISGNSSFVSLRTLKVTIADYEDIDRKDYRQDLVRRFHAFLKTTPRLETLGLKFTKRGGVTDFLTEFFTTFPFNQLETFNEIEIVNVSMKAPILYKILQRFSPTIRRLSLHNARVGGALWSEILEWIQLHMHLTKLVVLNDLYEWPIPIEYEGTGLDDFLDHCIDEIREGELDSDVDFYDFGSDSDSNI